MTFHQEVSSEVKVGSRVACNGNRGTVKYIGTVSPYEGTWLGIEWDDPSRGKHDGSHNNVRYFETRYPKSGSFVRPQKVTLGQSVANAIIERYGAVEGDKMAGVNKTNLELLKHEIKARFVEVVGFDKVNMKQSRFEELKIVSVSNMLVNGAGPPEQLKKMCPSVIELDVSKNLLNTWKSTAEISVQLEQLENLTVSENILLVPHNPEVYQDHFKTLNCVVAANMGYDWLQILQCAIMWKNVEILKVPKNNISKLESPQSNVLTSLRVLDLSGNLIEDWEEINKLGAISSLEELNVCITGVCKIHFPEKEKTNLFPSLLRLNVSENKIKEWDSVNELNKLKSLEDLWIRENPLLKLENPETTRQIIIAKIANLKVLNGLGVCDERKSAEYDYLKKYALEWIDLDGLASTPIKESKIQQFLHVHPMFPELISKYGLPEISELKVMPRTISESLFNIKLQSPNCPGKIIEKTVVPTTEVSLLQALARRIFKLRKAPQLSYISTKMPGVVHPMPFFTRNINFYGVEDGDTIIVEW